VGHGFADVWYKDHFAVEYKTARQHRTLGHIARYHRSFCVDGNSYDDDLVRLNYSKRK
jgi:hypothetical protein